MADSKQAGVSGHPPRPIALRENVLISTSRRNPLTTADRLQAVLKWTAHDLESGRYRKLLYRFLTDHIPVVSSCLWTWVRLSAAPGRFHISGGVDDAEAARAAERLSRLTERLYADPSGQRLNLEGMLPELFTSLYRDGIFAGFVTVQQSGSGVDCFLPLDPLDLIIESDSRKPVLVLERDDRRVRLDRPDFYFVPFNASVSQPFGRSILQTVPFVAYVEQQMVDDLRRTSHNAGYHRLHIKIAPPERMAAESDQSYTDRINGYFDSTVRMIKSLEVDDNPVTWDNIEFRQVGPDKPREVTNSWFMSHRAMVEEICAGTHLAPYLLGYSYGATTTWAGFKFDVVMRQVRSVQAEVARFLEWLGNVDLALAGFDARCRFEFDNSFAYRAKEQAEIETARLDNVIKLLQNGLIDQAQAAEKVRELL